MNKNNIVLSLEDFTKTNKKGNNLYFKTLEEINELSKLILQKRINKSNNIISDTFNNLNNKFNDIKHLYHYLDYLIDLENNGVDINNKNFTAIQQLVKSVAGKVFEFDIKKIDTDFDFDFDIDFDELNKIATTTDNIRELLQKGIVEFSYKKINGDIKKTKGTTNLNLIPKEKQPIKELTIEKIVYGHLEDTIKYFDVNINEWRSFKKDNIL